MKGSVAPFKFKTGETLRTKPPSSKTSKRMRTSDLNESRISTSKTTAKQTVKSELPQELLTRMEKSLTVQQLKEIERQRVLTTMIRMFCWEEFEREQTELLQKEKTLREGWREIKEQSRRLSKMLPKVAASTNSLPGTEMDEERKELLQRLAELQVNALSNDFDTTY